MIISKNSLAPLKKLEINEVLTDFVKPFSYPINDIYSIEVSGYLLKNKQGDIEASLSLDAKVSLRDSRDDSIFDDVISLDEDFLILEVDDGEKEGYIVEGKEIDINSLLISLLLSSLPLQVKRPDSKLPKSGDGYRVLTDEEEKELEPYNPAFDKLKDLDL